MQKLEARNAEIAKLNKRLEERLDSLSTLTGGVSHEVNKLSVISGNVEILQENKNTPDKQQKRYRPET